MRLALLAFFAWAFPFVLLAKPIPVVLDTDMGFDDWMALLYVAKDPNVDLKAVTISCDGETYCNQNQGAINAAKLLMLAGKPNVPVYPGTLPRADYWPTFPQAFRDSSSALNNIKGTKTLPYNTDMVHPLGTAATTIADLAEQAAQAKQPITILSIGTSTNIAQAYNVASNKRLFVRGIHRVYKGGGAVGDAVYRHHHWHLTNYHIKGNLFIPFFSQTNNDQAEWNIYTDAAAAEQLIAAHIPVTFVPTNLSDQVPITEATYNTLKQQAGSSKAAQFVLADILSQVTQQGGWANTNMDYWDPSVVVSALNPSLVTQTYQISACVNTHGKEHVSVIGKTQDVTHKNTLPYLVFSGRYPMYYYGALLVNQPYVYGGNSDRSLYTTKACDLLREPTEKVTVYTSINVPGFYTTFINTVTRD